MLPVVLFLATDLFCCLTALLCLLPLENFEVSTPYVLLIYEVKFDEKVFLFVLPIWL